MRLSRAILLLATLAGSSCRAPQPNAWADPANHRVVMVSVAPQVQLEVLDWGGANVPMVFLAGLGDTGHAFDEFAARFQDGFRPIAITRRGFGASSQPDDGYDSDTRARDIIAVLDSLQIARVILVGHSIAGDELSRVAAAYPDRLIALVYLEAYSYGTDSPSDFPEYPPQAEAPEMSAIDSASVQSVIAYWPTRFMYRPVEADVRAVCQFGPSGRLELLPKRNAARQVFEGASRSEYARIAAPALAIYAPQASLRDFFPQVANFDEQNRVMAQRYLAAQQAFETAQIARFQTEVRNGKVMTMPSATHYLHYQHADTVERAIRQFLSTTSSGAGAI